MNNLFNEFGWVFFLQPNYHNFLKCIHYVN